MGWMWGITDVDSSIHFNYAIKIIHIIFSENDLSALGESVIIILSVTGL